MQSSDSHGRTGDRRLVPVGGRLPSRGGCPYGALPCEKREQLEELLAVLVHDLRDPLTVILGYSQLLDRAFKRGESMNDYEHSAETIARMAKRVDKLVQVLVESAGLESAG